METEEPPLPAGKKPNNRKGGGAKKKTVVLDTDSENEVNDVDDDDDFEVVQQPAAKKGGRKPAAKKAPAATKKRNVGTKQTLGQKLLTDMLQPAEGTGTSPEKKVRKMRESPFNKKSGSILGRAANKDKSPGEDLSSGSGSATNSPLNFEEEVVEVAPPPARARPQRANRTKTKYVVSESEESDHDDSDDNVEEFSDFEEDED